MCFNRTYVKAVNYYYYELYIQVSKSWLFFFKGIGLIFLRGGTWQYYYTVIWLDNSLLRDNLRSVVFKNLFFFVFLWVSSNFSLCDLYLIWEIYYFVFWIYKTDVRFEEIGVFLCTESSYQGVDTGFPLYFI